MELTRMKCGCVLSGQEYIRHCMRHLTHSQKETIRVHREGTIANLEARLKIAKEAK